MAGLRERHVDEEGDRQDTHQAGDHQVAAHRLPAVLDHHHHHHIIIIIIVKD